METAELQKVVLDALAELKAKDTVVIDVTKLTSITDCMIVTSGTSSRHVQSIADNVFIQAKQHGCIPLGMEGQTEGEWVLVDLGNIIVHVMQPKTRDFYNLEKLWSMEGSD